MLEKIISTGMPGVEQAALDAAVKMNMLRGGWVAGRREIENRDFLDHYGLQVLPHAGFTQTLEANIRDADGVLIISQGKPTGNCAITQRISRRDNRPCLHIDLEQSISFDSAKLISDWIKERNIEILFVTGPEKIDGSNMYHSTTQILETTLYFNLFDPQQFLNPEMFEAADHDIENDINLPDSLDKIVELFISRLTFQEKTRIANIPESKLVEKTRSLQIFVRNEYRLQDRTTKEILPLSKAGSSDFPDDPAEAVLYQVWKTLQHSGNVLRVVK